MPPVPRIPQRSGSALKVDPGELVRRQGDVEGAERVVQLGAAEWADQREGREGLAYHPGERDLRRGAPVPGGQLAGAAEPLPVGVRVVDPDDLGLVALLRGEAPGE